jgi:uncharacterized protein (TIGR03083 family)
MTDIANDQISALAASVAHLRKVADGLGPEQLRAQAYPTEWSISDVLSHVGSGAETMQRRLDAFLAGEQPADDFAQPIWDAWNAKSPEAKAADALDVDRKFVDRLESLTDDEKARVDIVFGPMRLDLADFVGLRLNEHALHTWDIEVTLDPSATVPDYAVPEVVDKLESIARFAGKTTGTERDLHVQTSEPSRDFILSLGADSVALTPRTAAHGRARARPRAPRGGVDPSRVRPPGSGTHAGGTLGHRSVGAAAGLPRHLIPFLGAVAHR